MGLWSDRARPVIEDTLAALPVGATEKECRRALRDAYPFGPREHHPYKVWCAECKKALEKRFAPKVKPTPPPELVFLARGRPWLAVRCDWHKWSGACLICGPLHDALRAALAHPDLLPTLRRAAEDPAALLIAQDVVEEATGRRPPLPDGWSLLLRRE